MATTHIEFEKVPDFEHNPEKRAPGRREFIRELKEKFKFVYRDYDKAGDLEDSMYYAGQIDAIHDILEMFGWRRKMDHG